MDEINYIFILGAGLLASGSPGPATLGIAGMSMNQGRGAGLTLAAGIWTGSLTWSLAAAFGLGAIMLANAWLFDVMRYVGAAYLLWLAWKSGKSALAAHREKQQDINLSQDQPAIPNWRMLPVFLRGYMLHLTNPKAILFFGALYSVALPPGTAIADLALVILSLALQNIMVFGGYALLFSSPVAVRGYARLKRWFETAFAACFGLGGLRILVATNE